MTQQRFTCLGSTGFQCNHCKWVNKKLNGHSGETKIAVQLIISEATTQHFLPIPLRSHGCDLGRERELLSAVTQSNTLCPIDSNALMRASAFQTWRFKKARDSLSGERGGNIELH